MRQLARGLGIGAPEDRARIRNALELFYTAQGYQAEFGSFSKGRLLLLASPAEHALLRYDIGKLRRHLVTCGLADLVSDVKIRTKPIGAPAA